MIYYIYILHSINHDKFYIGYTTDVNKRLKIHNSSHLNTFTSKYRPWIVYALFEVGENKTTALKIEKYIKMHKNLFPSKLVNN